MDIMRPKSAPRWSDTGAAQHHDPTPPGQEHRRYPSDEWARLRFGRDIVSPESVPRWSDTRAARHNDPTPTSQEHQQYTSGYWPCGLFREATVLPESATGWSDTGAAQHKDFFRDAFDAETSTADKEENFGSSTPFGKQYKEYSGENDKANQKRKEANNFRYTGNSTDRANSRLTLEDIVNPEPYQENQESGILKRGHCTRLLRLSITSKVRHFVPLQTLINNHTEPPMLDVSFKRNLLGMTQKGDILATRSGFGFYTKKQGKISGKQKIFLERTVRNSTPLPSEQTNTQSRGLDSTERFFQISYAYVLMSDFRIWIINILTLPRPLIIPSLPMSLLPVYGNVCLA
jgi:hypothetical protein